MQAGENFEKKNLVNQRSWFPIHRTITLRSEWSENFINEEVILNDLPKFRTYQYIACNSVPTIERELLSKICDLDFHWKSRHEQVGTNSPWYNQNNKIVLPVRYEGGSIGVQRRCGRLRNNKTSGHLFSIVTRFAILHQLCIKLQILNYKLLQH